MLLSDTKAKRQGENAWSRIGYHPWVNENLCSAHASSGRALPCGASSKPFQLVSGTRATRVDPVPPSQRLCQHRERNSCDEPIMPTREFADSPSRYREQIIYVAGECADHCGEVRRAGPRPSERCSRSAPWATLNAWTYVLPRPSVRSLQYVELTAAARSDSLRCAGSSTVCHSGCRSDSPSSYVGMRISPRFGT